MLGRASAHAGYTKKRAVSPLHGHLAALAGQLEFNAIIQAVATEISHIIPHDHMDVCIKQLDDKYHIAYESGLASAWSRQPPALLTVAPFAPSFQAMSIIS